MAGELLIVSDVVREYPAPAAPLRVLDGVSLALAAGESAAITGPSGSGKTTLLNIIGTLDSPTSGAVTFDGKNLHELDPASAAALRNSDVGFVFQDHHLLPQLTALENVLLPRLAFGRAGDEAVSRAEELLGAVGLTDRAGHFPSELSGGERQRVAVARAMMNGPRLVLCDEPTGDLDAASAEAVSKLILSLRDGTGDGTGAATIVVTHNESVAGRFGRRLRLEGGVLVE